jgi:hypothetical protein
VELQAVLVLVLVQRKLQATLLHLLWQVQAAAATAAPAMRVLQAGVMTAALQAKQMGLAQVQQHRHLQADPPVLQPHPALQQRRLIVMHHTAVAAVAAATTAGTGLLLPVTSVALAGLQGSAKQCVLNRAATSLLPLLQ